jgi:adenylate kinase
MCAGARQNTPTSPVTTNEEHSERIRRADARAPGSGKGTHGVRIAERYDVPHLSTGKLLREHVRDGTELGRCAQPHMQRGDLVPDELIFYMVQDQLTGPQAREGYVLDGFPRTVSQAHAAYEVALRAGITVDAVVYVDLDHEELMRRLDERAQQLGRHDDQEAVIRHRIEVYEGRPCRCWATTSSAASCIASMPSAPSARSANASSPLSTRHAEPIGRPEKEAADMPDKPSQKSLPSSRPRRCGSQHRRSASARSRTPSSNCSTREKHSGRPLV